MCLHHSFLTYVPKPLWNIWALKLFWFTRDQMVWTRITFFTSVLASSEDNRSLHAIKIPLGQADGGPRSKAEGWDLHTKCLCSQGINQKLGSVRLCLPSHRTSIGAGTPRVIKSSFTSNFHYPDVVSHHASPAWKIFFPLKYPIPLSQLLFSWVCSSQVHKVIFRVTLWALRTKYFWADVCVNAIDLYIS